MNEENEKQLRPEKVIRVQDKVESISEEEMSPALKKVRRGKVVGPDNLPAEVWKCLGEVGVRYLTRVFNKLLDRAKMPEQWRRSVQNKIEVQ